MVVSDDFVQALRLFNLEPIDKYLCNLDDYERYLLTIASIDLHIKCPISLRNYALLKDEVEEYFHLLETEKTKNPILAKLVKDTDDSIISITNLVDNKGDFIRILRKDEVREYKLSKILDK